MMSYLGSGVQVALMDARAVSDLKKVHLTLPSLICYQILPVIVFS